MDGTSRKRSGHAGMAPLESRAGVASSCHAGMDSIRGLGGTAGIHFPRREREPPFPALIYEERVGTPGIHSLGRERDDALSRIKKIRGALPRMALKEGGLYEVQ